MPSAATLTLSRQSWGEGARDGGTAGRTGREGPGDGGTAVKIGGGGEGSEQPVIAISDGSTADYLEQ